MGQGMTPSGTLGRAAIALVLLTAAVSRMWDIGTKSLWVDEARALAIALQSPAEIIAWCRGVSSHEPPGRLLLMHAAACIPPNIVFSVRMPSLLAGLALLPLAWALTRRAGGGCAAGAMAVLFVLFSPALLDHSQDARYYTVRLALETGAAVALLTAWRAPELRRLWILAGLAASLALTISYTSLPSSAAVVLVCSLLAVRPGRDPEAPVLRRGAVTALVCFAAPLFLWLLPSLRVAARFVGLAPAPPLEPAFERAPRAALRFAPDWDLSLVTSLLHPSAEVALVVALAVVSGAGVVWRRSAHARLLLGLVLGLTATAALGTDMRAFLAPRYVIHLHFLALVLAAVALGTLWESSANPAPRIAAAGLALMICATALPALWRVMTLEKQNWRGAAELIASHFTPGDVIVTGAYWSEKPIQFYLQEPEIARAIFPHVLEEERFRPMVRHRASVWYVGWGEVPPFVRQTLDTEFRLVARLAGTQGDVSVYKKGPLPPGA